MKGNWGLAGIPGMKGNGGIAGPKGDRGAYGRTGSTGQKGSKGERGKQGLLYIDGIKCPRVKITETDYNSSEGIYEISYRKVSW